MFLSKVLLLSLMGCGESEKQDTSIVDTQEEVDTSSEVDTGDTAEEDVDEDGDGYDTSLDCDDSNPYAYPGAAENDSTTDCMSDRDEDGFGDSNPADGVTAGTDCDDEENITYPGSAENDSTTDCMTDEDGDGYGLDSPIDGVTAGTDCDDEDTEISPEIEEIVDDGIDQNCDGEDEETPVDEDGDGFFSDEDCDDDSVDTYPGAAFMDSLTDCMRDIDGDGYGDTDVTGDIVAGSDCNDTAPTVSPGATEVAADGIDNDCDSLEACYIDADGDGYGSTADDDGDGQVDTLPSVDMACDGPLEIDNSFDCDDANSSINPGATEIANDGIDQDCDGQDLVQIVDLDGDGFYSDVDCDDGDPSIYPGATEVTNDGVDQDCDGQDLTGPQNVDGDGFYDTVDCDDTDPFTYPGAAESETNFTLCMTDVDGDGYGSDNPASGVTAGTDCDDSSASVYPGATEIEDSIDNDCNGLVDDISSAGTDLDGDGYDDTVDCNDYDNDTHPGAAFLEADPTLCMTDSDGDGYGDLNPISGVEAGTDCDDADEDTNPGSGYFETDPTLCMTDADLDGYGDENPITGIEAGTDCDDALGGVYPGAIEIQDGLDNDCNGAIDDISSTGTDADGDGFDDSVDCDDSSSAVYPGAAINEDDPTICTIDSDGDGYGDANPSNTNAESGTDCDDSNVNVHPGMTEDETNNIDDNCDGQVDEAAVEDTDGDGFDSTVDCDDTDPSINPDADELCDSIDQNCDGDAELGAIDSLTWFLDSDGDGFGDTTVVEESCTQPSGYVTDDSDCDDADSTINPDATDVLLDCDPSNDGSTGTDSDGDGFDSTVDCDDTDPSINPDTVWYEDADEDTYGDPNSTQTSCTEPVGFVLDDSDCDDTTAAVNTDATEVAGDGIDQNCDGLETCFEELDGDGYPSSTEVESTNIDCSGSGESLESTLGEDCNDLDAGQYPGAIEYCNLEDDDCNGQIDDNVVGNDTYYEDTDGDGFGDGNITQEACGAPTGFVSTDGDCDDNDGTINPGADELCDSIDHDCDGDTQLEAIDATIWYADSDIDAYGDSDSSQESCTQPSGYVADDSDCDDSDDTINPAAEELCDVIDQNCDGDAEAGAINASTWYEDADSDNFGNDQSTAEACSQPTGYVMDSTDCDDNDPSVNPGITENPANSIDDNCDGTVDETTSGTDADGDGVTAEEGDCDDNDAAVGITDDDGDGYSACNNIDCDDDPNTGTNTYPGAAENESLGDCMKDDDGDGYGDDNPSKSSVTAGTDCDDINPTGAASYPGATDIPGNGLDEDCDGSDAALVDADGDGYTNDIDCDDDDATINPGVSYDPPNDGIDQDCIDGDNTATLLDVDSIVAGDVVITEVMVDPSVVSDSNGEWFEIYNVSGYDILLDGVTFRDGGSNSFVVSGMVFIPADRSIVLGRSEDATINGDVVVDYEYGTAMTLANSDDEIFIEATAGIIDGFEYDGTNYTISAGYTLQLDMSLFSSISDVQSNGHTFNDDPTNWCLSDASATYGLGDYGTPNDMDTIPTDWYVNPACGATLTDDDGDGYTSFEDCDDSDANVFPGSAENESLTECMEDIDGDGYGAETPISSSATAGSDCDDTDATIHPAVSDALLDCDPNNDTVSGTDDDGDGVTVEDGDCDDTDIFTYPGAAGTDSSTDCMTDADEDGYGDITATGDVVPGTDCDDSDGTINPGETEVQDNGIDEDCDPANDNTTVTDNDGDGVSVEDGDCDDNDSAVTIEDADGDGVNCSTDCDDTDALTYPGIATNETDPSLCTTDVDGDGYGDDSPSKIDIDAGTDCNDIDSSINPGATDIPNDSLDQDCDGSDAALVDADGDGYDNISDCDDTDSSIYPTALDVPGDGIDQDCDGLDAVGTVKTVADMVIGTFVITEIMVNPAIVGESDGEWFELVNTSGDIYNLNGLTLQDEANGTHTVSDDVYVGSEDFVLFVRNGDSSLNSGLSGDYTYGSILFNNTGSEYLRILGGSNGSTIIDEFAWSSSTLGISEGRSIMFDGDVFTALNPLSNGEQQNDNINNWCDTALPYGDGDNTGTPKTYNNSCSTLPVDNDNDTYYDNVSFELDCDDTNDATGQNTYPGAAENDSTTDCMTDFDGDGFGSDSPGTGVTAGTDCDDDDATINPSSTDLLLDCDPTNDGTPSYTYSDFEAVLSGCLGCHSSTATNGFYLSYGTTVSVASNDIPAMNLIEPNDPANSYLWHKLNGTHNNVGGSGARMPLNGTPLSSTELSIVESWINDGAPQ